MCNQISSNRRTKGHDGQSVFNDPTRCRKHVVNLSAFGPFAAVGILMLSLNVACYRLYKEIASCVFGSHAGATLEYASSAISIVLIVLFVLLIPEPKGLGVVAFLLSWPLGIVVRYLVSSCVGHRVEILEELGRLISYGLVGLILLILVLYLLRIESRHGIPV